MFGRKQSKIKKGNPLPGRKGVSRVSVAGSHPEFGSLQPEIKATANAVSSLSEMTVELNEEVELWVSVAQSAER